MKFCGKLPVFDSIFKVVLLVIVHLVDTVLELQAVVDEP
jgi:hypothetical protein